MEINVLVLSTDLLEVRFWHAFEQETQDTVRELGWVGSFCKVALEAMDDMHLQIHQFSVDRVLRRRVEMILHSIKFGLTDVLIKQRDGFSLQEALFL